MSALELVHWLGMVVVIATLALQIIPTPDEITSHGYLIFFNTIRRIANLKPNSVWQAKSPELDNGGSK